MATRSQARGAVLELLYAQEVGNDKVHEQAKDYFMSKKIKNKQQDFAISLLVNTSNHLKSIDNLIKKYAQKWEMDRIGYIEKTILRIAVYEMKYELLDKSVAINEAIELCKLYDVGDAIKFINGILDSIANKELA